MFGKRPTGPPRIVCLSNVHDHQYETLRGEEVEPCLSSPKRRDLFRCLEQATGREVVLLSSPPRPRTRRTARWLPAVQTRFSTHRQNVCRNWDAPKVRVPLSWCFYACQALRHTRGGDWLMLDNYEFIYVLAAWLVRLLRGTPVFLDYEDGKHLVPSRYWTLLNALAERLGRPLVRAALLAHPSLGERLPKSVPTLLVPGFVVLPEAARPELPPAAAVQILYSGTLDRVRGVDLLLAAIPLLPEQGWHLHLTGRGELEAEAARLAAEPGQVGRVTFHGTLADADFARLMARCHVGLNCQRSSDPLSAATFPSKVFSYLSAGLAVVSSRASQVPAICGDACRYYDEESPFSLAEAITRIVVDYPAWAGRATATSAIRQYTIEQTARRLREMLASADLT